MGTTETIEVEVVHTSTKKIVVELPYYSKDAAHNYKVISKDVAMRVYRSYGDSEVRIDIDRSNVTIALKPEKSISSAEEFNEAFDFVIEKIKAII